VNVDHVLGMIIGVGALVAGVLLALDFRGAAVALQQRQRDAGRRHPRLLGWTAVERVSLTHVRAGGVLLAGFGVVAISAVLISVPIPWFDVGARISMFVGIGICIVALVGFTR
jgi:hypothetical protein